MNLSPPNIGVTFPDRRKLHAAGIHRGLQAGIAPEGESIVLSGGYVDDIDDGDLVIYTGQGGRDADTGRQVADQTLSRGNRWLAHNYIEGIPVRVSRGYQLDSPYSPKSGYRYDGLYQITSYWNEKGRDGFLIYRFRLERLPGQPPIGNSGVLGLSDLGWGGGLGNKNPQRELTTSSRIVRSTAVANRVKEHYDHTCQVCGVRLSTPAGPYAEGCHVRPLGKPHNGPDTTDNVLCLCPNCHVLFDTHAMTLDEKLVIAPLNRPLRILTGHSIHQDHVKYRLSISRIGRMTEEDPEQASGGGAPAPDSES